MVGNFAMERGKQRGEKVRRYKFKSGRLKDTEMRTVSSPVVLTAYWSDWSESPVVERKNAQKRERKREKTTYMSSSPFYQCCERDIAMIGFMRRSRSDCKFEGEALPYNPSVFGSVLTQQPFGCSHALKPTSQTHGVWRLQ
jgi:hypothetical protein